MDPRTRRPIRRAARSAAALAVAAGMLAVLPSASSAQQAVTSVRARAGAADGWLGVRVLEVVGMSGDGPLSLVEIREVAEGGPSALAGLRAGDRVVRVNGRPATPAAFNEVASALVPGQAMRLTVERPGGRTVELTVTAGAAPVALAPALPPEMAARVESNLQRLDSLRVLLVREDSLRPALVRGDSLRLAPSARVGGTVVLRRGEAPQPEGGSATVHLEARPLLPWLEGRSWVAGARFTPVNPDLAAYFDVEGGLLVTEVIADTPLPAAGVRPGDVIVAVDGRPVRALEALRRALASPAPDGFVLSVVRHGRTREVRLGG